MRLAEIDALESRQLWGACQSLADLAFQRSVRVEVVDTDRYSRTVEKVWLGGLDVNRKLVRRGDAGV